MLDFKKDQKELYQPKTTPSIVDVPEMTFIVVSGKGDPNQQGGEFQFAVELLYGLSYAIKMTNKDKLLYVVPPLEGIWRVDSDISNKSKFEWIAMLRQPDFVTEKIFEAAKTALAKKKKHLDTSKARLETFTEGLCVQVMHIGSYDSEPATIEILEKWTREKGYVFDCADDSVKTLSRRHREIYLLDARKTEAGKMKTVIRYPIKKK